MTPRRVLLRACALVLLLAILLGLAVAWDLRAVSSRRWDLVRGHADNVVALGRLRDQADRAGRLARSFLQTGESRLWVASADAAHRFDEQLDQAATQLESPASLALVNEIRDVTGQLRALRREVDQARLDGKPVPMVAAVVEPRMVEPEEQMDKLLDHLQASESLAFDEAKQAAIGSTQADTRSITVIAVLALAGVVTLSVLLTRAMLLLLRSRDDLAESNRALAETNRDLDAFAGRVAHDLRNLLSPVSVAASALGRRELAPGVVQGIAGRLERVSRRAEGLIGALLLFARAGAEPGPSASTSVRQALHEVLEDLEPSVRNLGVRVSLQVEDEWVACGQSLLHSALANLVGNAVKFLEGCDLREVRVTARRTGEYCEITVVDTGPGFPPEVQRDLFLPFYRVPGTRGRGTGIGLATVHRILSAHHGTVTAHSDGRRGSVFTVRLPRSPVPLSTPAADRPLPSGAGGRGVAVPRLSAR